MKDDTAERRGEPTVGSFGKLRQALRLRLALVAAAVGGGVGVRGEPLVEGDGEGEEFLLAVDGVDHFDVELSVREGWLVEILDVVEKIAGEGGMRLNAGGFEAEVLIILHDFLVHVVMNRDGNDGNLGATRLLEIEEAAVDVVLGGRWDLVVVGRDELHTGLIEGEGVVAVVGDDDADGQQTVLNVLEAEEGALFRVVARVGCDGDVLGGMSVGGWVLDRGPGRGSRLVRGEDADRDEAQGSGQHCAEGNGGQGLGSALAGLVAMRVHAGKIILFADTGGKSREFQD